MLANGAGWQAVKVFLLLKHSWSYAKAKHIRTDMKLLEVTMIYAGKDGTKEELLVLRANQELWEWNVAAPLSRWFWYVLILSGSDGLSGIATPSVIKLLYITVRTSIYYICIFLYFIIYILVTNSIPHTLGITRMTSKRKGPSAYTGIVCIWCLYIGHYWTWLDFVFVSLFIMYICVCFFCLHLHQWHLAPDMISHYVLYRHFPWWVVFSLDVSSISMAKEDEERNMFVLCSRSVRCDSRPPREGMYRGEVLPSGPMAKTSRFLVLIVWFCSLSKIGSMFPNMWPAMPKFQEYIYDYICIYIYRI